MFGAIFGFMIWLFLFSAFYTTASAYYGAWLDLSGDHLALAVGSFWLFILIGMASEFDQ